LALVTLGIVPALAVVAAYFRIRARDAYREARRRLAALNAFLQESLQGVAVVQLFARERHEHAIFRRLNRDYARAMLRSTVFEATLYASVEALGSLALALLIWYGGGQIAAGTLSFGALVAFIQYTNRFFLPIRDLGAKYTVMQAAMASAERIFELLDVVAAVRSTPAADQPARSRENCVTPRADGGAVGGDVSSPPTFTSAVEFGSVWFAYEDERWVLRDCGFTVQRGEHVAIVGATGEGKTTCARLLNRFYDVARGRVLVEGMDVREWDLAALRRHVGIIFQDTVLFTGSVETNLQLGLDGRVTRADLDRAIDAAHCRRLVHA